MERPIRFEDSRWLGDKRTQRVHDLDNCDDPDVIDELVESRQVASFGPDTFVEAANRGYRPCNCAGAVAARAADAA
jgi:hypothetical protein